MYHSVCARGGAQEMSAAPPRADTGEVGLNVNEDPQRLFAVWEGNA